MAFIAAFLIALGAIVWSGVVMFAGSMRTTGGTADDSKAARRILIGGAIVAAGVAASHWIGW
jgi:hypothetical protein